ncbi:PREDICTED: G-protein coupled receptor 64-like, partial [Thamnophis sirtalis]|uniref:G-protein coupled receptor 64-like n=1 Tax=Thamnophis sirtalis TaxID=35019 RepID=A0A6I9YBZ6_9SAUR
MAACTMNHISTEKVWECLLKLKISLGLLFLHLILASGRASDTSISSNLRNFSVSTTNLSSFGTLDTAGAKKVCKLSDICKDSVFYMGSMKFQIRENNSNTSYNLTVKYPGNNTNLYQLKVSSTQLPEINISDFNKTLQRLSQSSLMRCNEINQSVVNCIFIIELEKGMNISNIVSELEEKAELNLIESCCCSMQPFSCPNAQELHHFQCDIHEPVACSGHNTPDSPVSPVGPSSFTMHYEDFSSELSSESTTVLSPPFTDPATINVATINATSNPFTELSSGFPTKSTNIFVPSTLVETINSNFTNHSIQPISTFPEVYPTTPTISNAQHTTSISSDFMSTSSSMIYTNNIGGPHKKSTEQISHNNSSITNSIDASNVNSIVSELEGYLTAETIAPSLGQSMLERVSFLLSMPQSQIYPMSKRIIKIVDMIGLKLKLSTTSINLTTPTLALAVLKVNSSSFSKVSFAVQHSSDLE